MRQVPWQFNSVAIVSPFEPIEGDVKNVGRARVRVFSKYRNRNGSYITDEVADALIKSAEEIHVPIVGFFDKENGDFTSHTSEELASAYGYCDYFTGWEKHQDEDGVEREYATFSVVLHTEYFEAANKIIDNPQSMELDVNSITGDWVAMDEGIEYFVYKTAKMKGFCVLGKDVEPCFEGAAFYPEKESRFERFSLLLEKVKDVEEKKKMEQFEELQQKFALAETELMSAQEKIEALSKEQENFDSARAEFENTIKELNERLEAADKRIADYEAQLKAIEDVKKQTLIDSYANSLDTEEIAPIQENVGEYSYGELEKELAVAFARKNLGKEKKDERVPIVVEEKSSLAKLMEKYRK